MTSSITYSPGYVVRVRIKFTAGEQTKIRPAVILTNKNYHNSRIDAIVVAVTSQLDNSYYGDYVLSDWKEAGLPSPCKAKGVIATIERSTIEGIYGKLSEQDFSQLKVCLSSMLGLDGVE